MANPAPPAGKVFGHYRVQGQLGVGGMGVVYSAYDTILERKVAIKVVGDRVLADKTARDLLLHEARAASSLNHPNICTIHEVGDSDGEAYIVMEQVDGQPLSSLLGTNGLPPDSVIRYGMQIADALAHAHEHGVVHRDLKSTNAMVTTEGRVKVLDFGLAARLRDTELQEATSSTLPLTDSRMIVGTLPYLAPELLRGEPADAKTDTWALGILLYEMASGKHPFPGRTAFELSSAILREAPTPLPANVPSGLRAVILRCLEKSPGERYQRASEVRAALESANVFETEPLPPLVGSRLRAASRLFFFVPLIFIALALAFNWRGSRDWLFHRELPRAGPAAVRAATPRKSVAVLGFQNSSKRQEMQWLSTALPQMLATELSAGEKLRIIPAENVARMKRDLSLAETDTLASDTLKRVHSYVGSDLVLVGSFTALGQASGGQLRVDAHLQDAATGETLASVAEAGSDINLFDLASRVGSDLRNRLGVGEVAAVDAEGVQASYPAAPEAARPFSEGVSRLRVMDSRAALPLLQKAVVADPKFPLAHFALARAWQALGYDAKAKDEARLAFELSGNLSREDRLVVEGQYRGMAQDWKVAVQVYSTLVRYFPDNAEYGLRLAGAQSRSGQAKDALVTLAALKALPPPQNNDPRIFLEEAIAKSRSGDAKGMLESAVKAANQAAVTGSKFVEAGARLQEGDAQHALGDQDKAMAAWEESRRLWASADYPGEVAKTMINIGGLQQLNGNMPEAKKNYANALAIWRTTGNELGQMVALANLALILHDEGDLAASKRMTQQSLDIARHVDAAPDVAGTLVDLGNVQIDLGDGAAALTSFLESVKVARQFGDRWTLAATLTGISRAYYLRGDLQKAKQAIQEAIDITHQTGDKAYEAFALANWGEILMAEGDLPQAHKKLQQALQIRTQIDEKSNAAASRLRLAALSIEQGKAADAERSAREVRDEYRKEGHPDDETTAGAVLLRALYAEHKFDEAACELENAKVVLAKSQNVPNRLALGIVGARIQAALGKRNDALQSLSLTMRDAAKSGFVPDGFDARLARAEIEIKSGKIITARAELATLRKDTTGKGFGLIAQKAAALMATSYQGD
jgi:serine/threonine protein kinase/tetratricopeptide (TPR) repeat protein